MAGTYTYSITNPFYGVDLTAQEPGLGQTQGLAQGLGLEPIDTTSPMLHLQTTTVNDIGVTTSVVVGRGKGIYYTAGGHEMKCVFVPAAGGIYARGGDGSVEKTVSLWVNQRRTIVKWGHPPPPLQRGMSPCYMYLRHLVSLHVPTNLSCFALYVYTIYV